MFSKPYNPGKQASKISFMQIDLIAGVGPNLIKIALIIEAIEKAKAEGKNIGYRVVRTEMDLT